MPDSIANSTCLELVIYQIKASHQDAFVTAHAEVTQALSRLPGFVSLHCHPDINHPYQYSDQVLWSNQTSALAAFDQFKTLPEAQTFLDCIETVLFSSHFKYCANDLTSE